MKLWFNSTAFGELKIDFSCLLPKNLTKLKEYARNLNIFNDF